MVDRDGMRNLECAESEFIPVKIATQQIRRVNDSDYDRWRGT